MPLEEQAKQLWPYVPGGNPSNGDADVMDTATGLFSEVTVVVRRQSFIARVKSLGRRARGVDQTFQTQSVRILVESSERSGSTSSESLTVSERNWVLV